MIRLVCILIGYVFGLFQTAFIIGKAHGFDIRDRGSGNAGTTNMMRTMGRGWGLLTFFGDCVKCIAACALVKALFGEKYADIGMLLTVYTAAGCILGHNFPFYLQFRGGKGIACTAGFAISLGDWILTGIGLVVFFGTVLITGYVSLGSLMLYLAILIAMPIMGQRGMFHMSQAHLIELYVVVFLLTLLAVWKHRENIKRIINGTESKAFGKK